MIWDQLLARPENFVQCFMTGGDLKTGGPLMLWARVSQILPRPSGIVWAVG